MNDPELANLATAVSETTARLLAHVPGALPRPKVDALDSVHATGGAVGLEVVTDGHGKRRISLIAIEREGLRRVLADVA